MTTDVDADDDAERLATVLGNILVLSANESLVAAQMEAFSFFSPMPASLPLSDDSPLESNLKNKRIICLDILDNYDFMDPVLVRLLELKAGPFLGVSQ